MTRFAPTKTIGATHAIGPESPRSTIRIAIVGSAVAPNDTDQ